MAFEQYQDICESIGAGSKSVNKEGKKTIGLSRTVTMRPVC